MKSLTHLQRLEAHEHKGLLRLIICGGDGDGKSALIECLLRESKRLFEGPPAAFEVDSKKDGTQECGIGVAHRYFSTDKRKFIIADTPGHAQYTRTMLTGASTADAAVLMVDARHGVLTPTRRHSFLMALMGIRHLVVAVDKMDLVEYSQARFDEVVAEYRAFAQSLDLAGITFIPLSALKGDNVVTHGASMPWYPGTTLMDYLETVGVDDQCLQRKPFRLSVQWVKSTDRDFRGFAGMISSGVIRTGDAIRVQPSGNTSRVARIYTHDGDLDAAVAGQSVTLLLEDAIDVSHGDVISRIDQPAQTADQFEASVVWMHDEPLLPGRSYLLKLGTQTLSATITDIKYQLNVNTLEHVAAKQLPLDGIGVCNLSLDRVVAFDPYRENKETGGFTLIDRVTHHSIGTGMLHFALRRSQNIHMQHVDVDKAARAHAKHQKPVVLWFTGLSGAGKSTIANLVEQKLHASGHHTYLLDGDNVRHGLNRDLGFTDADRVENIRRVAEVARLMVDAGLIVLTAFISPFRDERQMARDLMAKDEFIEIFVDTPLSLAEARDPKGLYKKARKGELKNFTGIDSAYETPKQPNIHLHTANVSAEEAADCVLRELHQQGIIVR